MRRDGHEVTVAAPPNVVYLERGYLQLTGFDTTTVRETVLDRAVAMKDDNPTRRIPRATHFFDLLAVHELAHLYHEAAPFRFPARWLMELFCTSPSTATSRPTSPTSCRP